MANFFKDNDDLRFYFEQAIDWGALVSHVERDLRLPDGFTSTEAAVAFYREVLENVGEFVADQVAPKAAEVDHAGLSCRDGEVIFPPVLEKIFKEINDLGLHGLCVPRELGGLNCPALVYFFTNELFARADVSIGAHYGFHGGMAMAMLFYALTEGSAVADRERGVLVSTRFDTAIAEILRGEAWGSMDLTEPDAGSDLARLRTKGEQDESGQWFVTGQKIFITSGHAKYHFVLARTEADRGGDAEDPTAGLAGLSLFFVPAYTGKGAKKRWLARVDRIEEKLGHHASPTVAITFDRTPGELVGRRGEGFRQMLLLMNNARIGVGFEGIGLCEAALRQARAYAAERRSMGKAIDRHEMIADYLDEMEVDIKAIRAIAMDAAFHEELAQRHLIAKQYFAAPDSLDAQRHEREHQRHKHLARRLTPVLKYQVAEKAVEIARRNLQIHGGVGYTKEYGAEKLVRDSLVLPIYEGTSQIQALMAMKDALGGIIKNPGGFMKQAAQARWRALSSKDPLEKAVARLQVLEHQALQHLVQRTATDKLRSLGGAPVASWPERFLKNWDPKRDFSYAMLHAERLIRLMADARAAELLWAQASRFPERRPLLEAWLERAEPRARHQHELITTTGGRLLARLGGGDEPAREVG